MIPEAMKIIENNMLDEDGIIVTKIDSIEEIYEGYNKIKLLKAENTEIQQCVCINMKVIKEKE